MPTYDRTPKPVIEYKLNTPVASSNNGLIMATKIVRSFTSELKTDNFEVFLIVRLKKEAGELTIDRNPIKEGWSEHDILLKLRQLAEEV